MFLILFLVKHFVGWVELPEAYQSRVKMDFIAVFQGEGEIWWVLTIIFQQLLAFQSPRLSIYLLSKKHRVLLRKYQFC